MFAPTAPSKSDQNSVVVLRTAVFDAASVVDVTNQAMAALSSEGKGMVASGDLIVLTAAARAGGRKYVLASFHGDTDGLATLPVLEAVRAVVRLRLRVRLRVRLRLGLGSGLGLGLG